MAMARDSELSKVLIHTKIGWSLKMPPVLLHYWNHKEELSVENGCLMWVFGWSYHRNLEHQSYRRFITPTWGQYAWRCSKKLCLVAPNRLGYWANGDLVYSMSRKQECTTCSPNAPLDLACETLAKVTCWLRWSHRREDILIIVDAHSKWPEVVQ